MTQFDVQRENTQFDANIALAELEEGKAHERVLELKYKRAAFNLEIATLLCKQVKPEPTKAST